MAGAIFVQKWGRVWGVKYSKREKLKKYSPWHMHTESFLYKKCPPSKGPFSGNEARLRVPHSYLHRGKHPIQWKNSGVSTNPRTPNTAHRLIFALNTANQLGLRPRSGGVFRRVLLILFSIFFVKKIGEPPITRVTKIGAPTP